MLKQVEGTIQEIYRWDQNDILGASIAYSPMPMAEYIPHSAIKVNNEMFEVSEKELEELHVGDKVRITISSPAHKDTWLTKAMPQIVLDMVDAANSQQRIEKLH